MLLRLGVRTVLSQQDADAPFNPSPRVSGEREMIDMIPFPRTALRVLGRAGQAR
jgi:hypothetical protein